MYVGGCRTKMRLVWRGQHILLRPTGHAGRNKCQVYIVQVSYLWVIRDLAVPYESNRRIVRVIFSVRVFAAPVLLDPARPSVCIYARHVLSLSCRWVGLRFRQVSGVCMDIPKTLAFFCLFTWVIHLDAYSDSTLTWTYIDLDMHRNRRILCN